MGEIKRHPPVKLIVGMIAADAGLFPSVEALLSQKFGRADFWSDVVPFDYTDYYTREMGTDLLRKFISFERLIQPEEIVEIKLFTNDLEKEFVYPNTDRRRANLDPGYVSAAKLVLASTKDHIHRIYLRDGIYAEITLRMEKKTFRPWQWTYPDYRSEEYIAIFNEIRRIYMEQLRSSGINAHPVYPIVR
jgi:hypothetical protein